MIQVKNLNFQYTSKTKILKDINLTFLPANIYGLLGKNGVGKSTIIKNIAGMLFPSSGTCSVFNQTPKHRKISFLKDIFFVPEAYYLPNIAIKNLISIYSEFYPKFDTKQFFTYLKEFQIDIHRKTNDLSLGQKKKILIGFALSANTKVLIMDEPTNGLDIPSKITFRNMINSSFNEERIVIISSHQVRDLDELINHIIIMDNGRILLSKKKDHIAKNLLFSHSATKCVHSDILYQEKVSNGYASIQQNKTNQMNYVDIELLFNGILSNKTLKDSL